MSRDDTSAIDGFLMVIMVARGQCGVTTVTSCSMRQDMTCITCPERSVLTDSY